MRQQTEEKESQSKNLYIVRESKWGEGNEVDDKTDSQRKLSPENIPNNSTNCSTQTWVF